MNKLAPPAMAYCSPEHCRYPFPIESSPKISILELSSWLPPDPLIAPTHPNLNLGLIRVELPASPPLSSALYADTISTSSACFLHLKRVCDEEFTGGSPICEVLFELFVGDN